jgi:predicted amidohydrolase YtcJ
MTLLHCARNWKSSVGAWHHFEEDEKGSITPGKRADLVILSDNPLTIEPMRLNEIVVLETIKDGRTVWRKETP